MHNNPTLYNIKATNHKNIIIKNNIWKEISSKIFLDTLIFT